MRKAKVWDARQLPAYLTTGQYGTLMGICPKTVRRMCQRGELPAHKVGPRLWRIEKNAALEQLKEQDSYSREPLEAELPRKRGRPKKKRPASAVTPTSQITIGDKTYQVEYTTTKAKIPV